MNKELLVTYNNLQHANPVENPGLLEPDTLSGLLTVARTLCRDNSYAAIAFNQIPQRLLENTGLVTINPSIIYLHDSDSDAEPGIGGQLLINPKIILESNRNYRSFEGCGSITDEYGNIPFMLVLRPNMLTGTAFVWKHGWDEPKKSIFTAHGQTAALADHEMHHLEGYSALSFPENLVDLRIRRVLRGVLRMYEYPGQLKIIRNLITAGAIVYDDVSGKIIRVGFDQSVLEEMADLNEMHTEIPFPSRDRDSVKIDM